MTSNLSVYLIICLSVLSVILFIYQSISLPSLLLSHTLSSLSPCRLGVCLAVALAGSLLP